MEIADKTVIPALIAAAIVAPACSRPRASEVEQTLKRLEIEWENAEATFDADTVDRIMADDWVGTEPDGTRHRKGEELADLRDHKGSLTSSRSTRSA
jgi:hypothetical protein